MASTPEAIEEGHTRPGFSTLGYMPVGADNVADNRPPQIRPEVGTQLRTFAIGSVLYNLSVSLGVIGGCRQNRLKRKGYLVAGIPVQVRPTALYNSDFVSLVNSCQQNRYPDRAQVDRPPQARRFRADTISA